MLCIKEFIIFGIDTAYVFAPVCGFIPQIYTGNINYNPILSLLTIFANILKLFPSAPKISSVLIYQFCFGILVHFYLIKSFIAKNKSAKIPFLDVIPNFRRTHQYFLATIFSFILLLGILDRFQCTGHFMRAALVIETTISVLHIKLLEKKSSLKILSIVMLLGDIAKTILFVFKFAAPAELIIATMMQLCVNVYLALR